VPLTAGLDPEAGALDPLHAPFMEAWETLRDDRPPDGFGGGGFIPFTAIDRWAERACIAGEDFDLYLTLIRALDGEYLRWRAEKAATGN